MKKFLTLLGVFIFLSVLSLPAVSAPKVVLDGQQLAFGVPPTIENGRTLVPLRAIFEALGANVSWDDPTQTVTATKADISIKLQIGSQTAYRNNQAVSLEVPSKIIENRTMVPLRFVSEGLGATVKWDQQTETISISSGSQTRSDIFCSRQPKPCITFTDDDSAKQFPGNWTPILQTYRIPVVCFIPTSYINDHGVSKSTIAAMEALGVEYCSHTHSHINLTTMTEEQIISECETSQNLIKSIGGNPDVIGYPGGASNALVRDICSRYFHAGFGGGDKTTSPNYNPSPLKKYDIKRIEMTPGTFGDPRQPTEAECLAMIDELVDNKGWRIFTFHSQNPTFNEAMKTQIAHMIEHAQAKGVEIVNMATALSYFGADEIIITGGRQPNGSIYSFGTSITDFPQGKVTEVLITGATSRWGFPRGTDGMLTTYRLEDTDGNLGKQEYRPNGYDEIWVRYADSNGNWLAFMPPPGLRGTTANRPTDAPANYCYYDTDLGKPIWATTAPARNIDKIAVTSGATGSGNITIRSTTVAITAGDTAEQVAAKIRAASIAGFSWGGYGTTCILLRFVPTTVSATTFTDTDSTGVTATVTRIIAGEAPVWKDVNGTVVK